ncbi:MAG: helix-hairpin-helix domain-containing protein [Prevotella sp.]|nr:helix-hairpin-helix domain-containing protein [Prevotella sp.]
MKNTLRKTLFLLSLCLTATHCTAQTGEPTWQQVYEEMMDLNAGEDETDDSDCYDLLEQLADHPLNLNTASREELEQLPFLSRQQVMDIVEYRDRYHGFSSLGELRMIASLNFQQVRLLPFFVVAAQAEQQEHFPKLTDIIRHSRHTLTATARLPFYQRKGDRNGYLGYRYRHWVNYNIDYADHLRLGVTASQDAGEPFMAGGNAWGYDLYNCYLQLRRLRRVEQLVAGKYKISTGMGLVMGTSFQLGKLASLQSMGRSTQSVRPHTSRSEADYFQGVAATLRLSPTLSLTAFASSRPVDATLTTDGQAQTLTYAGYHRTTKEMEKKYNTWLTAGGGSLALRKGPFRTAVNAVFTHLNRRLSPDRSVLYRRYYAHGNNFINASIDYAYASHRLSASGETAVDAQGHLATLNSATLRLNSNLSLVVLQRFYSYRYTSLYGHSFSDANRVQNESGLYVGTVWRPLPHWQLQAYADYASHPWARYQVSRPSHAADMLLHATYDSRRLTVEARYRTRLRQKDNADKSALTADDSHRLRLTATLHGGHAWTSKTQVDVVSTRYKQTARGWLAGQRLTYSHGWLALSMTAACFDTDAYQSRVYMYEPHVQGDFSMPSYYGEGLRLTVMGRADIGSHVRLTTRLGYVDYFDRQTIGSGLQQTDRSHATDLDLQLRWRF